MNQPTMPVIYISHGGGPCFWITMPPPFDPGTFNRLASYFGGIVDHLPSRPTAVLVITGHWETPVPTFATSEAPPMLYDYSGFPPHTYQLRFPARGAPALAERARGLLAEAGIASAEDNQRGFDHGVFVPMMKITPHADLPVLAMSICADLDPARHIAIGRALAPLRQEGVLIVASGLSYHNLRRIFDFQGDSASVWNDWLVRTVTDTDVDRRDANLTQWTEAPCAREAHPRADHLLPLMVAAGAGGLDRGHLAYADLMANKPVSGFQFG